MTPFMPIDTDQMESLYNVYPAPFTFSKTICGRRHSCFDAAGNGSSSITVRGQIYRDNGKVPALNVCTLHLTTRAIGPPRLA